MSNNFALITGASSGIGLEIAKCLAKKKYNVILTARSEKKLIQFSSEISQNCGVKSDYIKCDLSEKDAPKMLYDFCESNDYQIDILINNAGYALPDLFHVTPMEDEEKFLRVLSTSVIALTKIFLPKMIESGKGNIMIVSSVAAYAPPSSIQSLYGPVKTFMNRFNESLNAVYNKHCLLYTSPSPRDRTRSRMPSSA